MILSPFSKCFYGLFALVACGSSKIGPNKRNFDIVVGIHTRVILMLSKNLIYGREWNQEIVK